MLYLRFQFATLRRKRQLDVFLPEITSNYHRLDVVDNQLMLTISEDLDSPEQRGGAGGVPGDMGGVADMPQLIRKCDH